MNLYLPHERAGRPLTRREREILVMAGNGQPNLVIADRLGISLQSVKNHLTHTYQKLEARGRTQAIYKALCNGELVLRE